MGFSNFVKFGTPANNVEEVWLPEVDEVSFLIEMPNMERASNRFNLGGVLLASCFLSAL